MTSETVLILNSECYPLPGWESACQGSGYSVRVIQDSDLQSGFPDIQDTQFSLIVEAFPVSSSKKQLFYQTIEPTLSQETLILSAALDVMAAKTASGLKHPDRLVGFSPLSTIKPNGLLSLARTPVCSEATRQKAEQFIGKLGLDCQWIEDTPGLVLPRIYAMLANEAAFAVQQGVASPEDIDTAMRLGTNYPMGPLAWADEVGLDVLLGILDNLWHVYREDRYRPCPLLQKLVLAGFVGKRAGRGFYHQADEPPSCVLPPQMERMNH